MSQANQNDSSSRKSLVGDSKDDSLSGQYIDVTCIPSLLDVRFDNDLAGNIIRPAIINPIDVWSQKHKKSLMATPELLTLDSERQKQEKNRAFALIDALTRSGALRVSDASLHVVMASVHSFEKTIMETVVQDNVNPIERVEQSTIVLASAIHNTSMTSLLKASQIERINSYSNYLA
jgi:isochorismate synthase EntC